MNRAERRARAESKKLAAKRLMLNAMAKSFKEHKDLAKAAQAADEVFQQLCRAKPQEKVLYEQAVLELAEKLNRDFEEEARKERDEKDQELGC